MAITTQTNIDRIFEQNVCIVTDYPGFNIRYIRHAWDCPHKNEQHDEIKHADCLPGCHQRDPLVLETSFEGCVISTRERNGYDDSDFFATVWNDANQCAEEIEYATTRGWTYANSAKVDATPEVLAKYQAWKIAASTKTAMADEEFAAKVPAAGKVCKVVAGRKFPKGLVVTVKRVEERVYGVGRWANRTKTALVTYDKDGIQTQGWVPNIENLEVVNPDQYKRSEAEIRANMERIVKNGCTYMSPRLAEALARIGR